MPNECNTIEKAAIPFRIPHDLLAHHRTYKAVDSRFAKAKFFHMVTQ